MWTSLFLLRLILLLKKQNPCSRTSWCNDFLQRQHHKARLHMKHCAGENHTDRNFQKGGKFMTSCIPMLNSLCLPDPIRRSLSSVLGPTKYFTKLVQWLMKQNCLLHPVSHVSQLKQDVPDHSTVFSKLPSAAELDISEVSPAAILDRCLLKKGNTALLQVLIKRSFAAGEDDLGRLCQCSSVVSNCCRGDVTPGSATGVLAHQACSLRGGVQWWRSSCVWARMSLVCVIYMP